MRKTTLLPTLRVFMLLIAALFAGGSTALAEDGLIKFGKAEGSVKIDAKSVTGKDNLNNEWIITTVMNAVSFTQNDGFSQVGSSQKPATSITFTMTLPAEKVITSLSAKLGGFNGTAGNVSLKVGETEVGTGKLDNTKDVTVESTSQAKGTTLTITVTGIAKGVKCYKIAYSYSEGGEVQETTAAPTLSKAATFDTESHEVTITNNEQGATVYYTTDGSNPTTESEQFAGDSKTITITTTTTLKAMAAIEGKNNSSTVTATYTKVVPAPTYENIAAYIAAKPKDKAKLKLTNALVYGNKNNKNIFVNDGTAMIQIYDKNGKLPAAIKYGTRVTAVVEGTYTLFKGQDELQDAVIVGEPTVTTTTTPYESLEVSADEVNESMVGRQVTVKGVTFQSTKMENNQVIVKDEETSLAIYNTLNVTLPAEYRTDVRANVTGFVLPVVNNNVTTMQIIPETADFVTYIEDQTKTAAPTLSEAGEFEGSKEVTITNNEQGATVYYTTDGNEPTTESEQFTGESKTITITATTTVKAMAMAQGKQPSAVASATYTLVTATPEIAFTQEAIELPMGTTTAPANALSTNSDGAITYESSDESVATVAQNGTVTLVAPGHVTITATAAATDAFQEAKASYSLLLLSGDGSWEQPYSPVDVIYSTQIDAAKEIAVAGYYVGYPGNNATTALDKTFANTAMALSTQQDNVSVENTIPAQLHKNLREGVALEDNIGQWVVVTGKKSTYFSKPGIKNNLVTQRVAMGEIEVPATGYATYFSTAPTIVPEGMKAGLMTIKDNDLLNINYCYAAGDHIPAGTGVLIQAAEGKYGKVHVAANTEVPADNYLYGSAADEETKAPVEDAEYHFYALGVSNTNSKVGFFWGADNGAAFTNKAGEAYLALPASIATQSALIITDIETGIGHITGAAAQQNGAIYDLQGRRVNRTVRGIYIQNGRKVMVK